METPLALAMLDQSISRAARGEKLGLHAGPPQKEAP